MARRTQREQPEFPARAAAEGTVITFIEHGKESELKAVTSGDGWAIQPTTAAEAAALERFSDEALNPPPPPETKPEADAETAGTAGEETQA